MQGKTALKPDARPRKPACCFTGSDAAPPPSPVKKKQRLHALPASVLPSSHVTFSSLKPASKQRRYKELRQALKATQRALASTKRIAAEQEQELEELRAENASLCRLVEQGQSLGARAAAACQELAGHGQEGVLEDVLELLAGGGAADKGARLLLGWLHLHLQNAVVYPTNRRYTATFKGLWALIRRARSGNAALRLLQQAGINVACPRTLDAFGERLLGGAAGFQGFSFEALDNLLKRAGGPAATGVYRTMCRRLYGSLTAALSPPLPGQASSELLRIGSTSATHLWAAGHHNPW